ncbi:hypothetical protein WL80_09875 [Burkholderia ubonensis]|uniref:hypothetical protein n=1 Tax=Burkholderia ubonensis TaxID=101571 RepID=UPI000758E2C5|nr:hypothetical protein [Burkholderia ubonensis]KVZ09743.1 hypothetical protein WL11_05865 [Burkholderia ubonensis]KWE93660.1 hypothetical protein WL80_09875 [Burkholderia ubonensis]
MKLKEATIAVILVLVACYIGAGAPSLELLLKPSVVLDGLALKAGTWHYMNHEDRAVPAPEFLASRFYTLIVAALCAVCGVAVARVDVTRKRLACLIAVAVALQFIFYYAQMRAFYLPW